MLVNSRERKAIIEREGKTRGWEEGDTGRRVSAERNRSKPHAERTGGKE